MHVRLGRSMMCPERETRRRSRGVCSGLSNSMVLSCTQQKSTLMEESCTCSALPWTALTPMGLIVQIEYSL